MPLFPPNLSLFPRFLSPAELSKISGIVHVHSGKVRESYELSGGYRLVVTTDRISALDHVLPVLIPNKGALLNAINIFWANKFHKAGYGQDLVAYGPDIDQYLPIELRKNRELWRTAVIVRSMYPLDIENIARGYLTGSGMVDYLKDHGKVSGHALPPKLVNGSAINPPIFTPSTKAQQGHDVPLDFRDVRKKYGTGPEELTLQLFDLAYSYAIGRGIIIADTKLEFALAVKNADPRGRILYLIDERFTPDSSRFWLADDWETTYQGNLTRPPENGIAPPSLDKEPVRQFLKRKGVKGSSSSEEVWALNMDEIILPTTQRYYKALWMLTGHSLQEFQKTVMNIS